MGQAEPTTTSALLRRLALPAVFVVVIAYSQLRPEAPPPSDGASAQVQEAAGAVTTELTGPTMGTAFTVKVRGDQELSGEDTQALSLAVQGALDGVNAAMSTWLKTSELSRFNDGPADTPFAFSAPTMEVLEVSQQVYEASGGAFDVTVGPLVNRWGFGPDDPQGPPDAAEVSALMATLGQDKLRVNLEAREVTKPSAAMRVDLSAVAKGYAVDQVAEAIEALGHKSYMVEVGGEVRARAADGVPWIIGVEEPSRARGPDREPSVTRRVALDGASMATSGDYRNFIKDGDKLRSHTIDPRTGAPVEHALASVTVIHPSCATADAWATALMVLGPERGLEVAREVGLAALFISRGAGAGEPAYRFVETEGFARYQPLMDERPVDERPADKPPADKRPVVPPAPAE